MQTILPTSWELELQPRAPGLRLGLELLEPELRLELILGLGLGLGLVLGPGLGLELVLRSEPELALWLGLGLGPARKASKLQPQQVSLLLLWVHDLSDLD